MEELRLKVQKIGCQLALSHHAAIIPPENWEVAEIQGTTWAILKVACQEEPIEEIPADWWQHFKLRWFPKWAKKKWPVRYEWVTAYHVFPEIPIPEGTKEYIQMRFLPRNVQNLL